MSLLSPWWTVDTVGDERPLTGRGALTGRCCVRDQLLVTKSGLFGRRNKADEFNRFYLLLYGHYIAITS